MNAIRTILYSLKRGKNDQSILSIDLTAHIVSETIDYITIKFPDSLEPITLNKYDWVNKDRIYDNGKVFFLVCNKLRNTDHVTNLLARHAIDRVYDTIETLFNSRDTIENADDRIEYLFAFKSSLKSLIKGNRLSLAS